MRARVVFTVACVFTMLVVVLFVEMDLPNALTTPLLKQQAIARDQDSRQWVLQDKNIIICKNQNKSCSRT